MTWENCAKVRALTRMETAAQSGNFLPSSDAADDYMAALGG